MQSKMWFAHLTLYYYKIVYIREHIIMKRVECNINILAYVNIAKKNESTYNECTIGRNILTTFLIIHCDIYIRE